MINFKTIFGNVIGLCKKHFKLFIALVLVIGILGFFGFRFLNKKNSRPQYQTAKVTHGSIVSTISSSGQILNSNTVAVTTQASGTVKQVFVTEGTPVKAGDKIMEIELDGSGLQRNSSAWSSYLSAKTSLDSANATALSLQSSMFTNWDAYMKLAQNTTYQNGDQTPNVDQRKQAEFYIAQDNWLNTEAKYKNQQQVINQAQAGVTSSWYAYQMSSPIVYAPANGTVYNLTVLPGVNVNTVLNTNSNTPATQQLCVIENQSLPLASFNLSEVDVNKVKLDQQATITLDSLPGMTFTGHVKTVDRIGVVSSGVTNYPIIIQLDTNVSQIIPNLAATANIIIDSKDNALLVPSAAIQSNNGQSLARVLRNGQEASVPVETGLTSDTQTEIVSGLTEGEEVITGTVTAPASSQGSSPFGLGGGRGNAAIFRGGR